MTSDRLKALTDGMIAVIITIMVLEMRPPHGTDLGALHALWPVFLSYILSFLFVAIYWNNHHHFFHLVRPVSASIMWTNLHLLFWLSLIPFATAWVGAYPHAPVPAAAYGFVLLACALAWTVMQAMIVRAQGPDSPLKHAIGRDAKGTISALLYLAGIGLSFVQPLFAYGLYAVVALLWLVPDRRVEKELTAGPS